MSLIRWDPLDDLASLRESTDRLFEELFARRPRLFAPTIWQPAVEIYETMGEVVLRAELPGIDPKDVDITTTDETLTIKGETQSEQEEKGSDYFRRELRYGRFLRTVRLPAEVEAEKAKASYRNGILEVRIPKAERAKPKTVKVQAA